MTVPSGAPDRRRVPEHKRLLTYGQVAELLNIDERTARRWESMGRLRAVRFGRTVRFRPEDVQRAIEKGTR